MAEEIFADLLSGLQPSAVKQPTADDLVSMEESRRKALSETDEVPVDRSNTPVGDNLSPPPPPLTKEEMQCIVHDTVKELLFQNFGALTNVLKATLMGIAERLDGVEGTCKEADRKLEEVKEKQKTNADETVARLDKMEAVLKESVVGIQRMLEKQDLLDAHVLLNRHAAEEAREKANEKDKKKVTFDKASDEEEDPPTLPKRQPKSVVESRGQDKNDDRKSTREYTTHQQPTSVQLPQPMHQQQMTPPVGPQGPPPRPTSVQLRQPMHSSQMPSPQPHQQEYQPPPGSQSFEHLYKPPYGYQPPENGYAPPTEKPIPPLEPRQPFQPPQLQQHPVGFHFPNTATPPPQQPPPQHQPPPQPQPYFGGYPTPAGHPYRPPPAFRPQQPPPPQRRFVAEPTKGTLPDRPDQTQPSSQSVPLDQVIADVANMGFDRTKVRSVVTQLLDHGENVDLNVVIDRLTNMGY